MENGKPKIDFDAIFRNQPPGGPSTSGERHSTFAGRQLLYALWSAGYSLKLVPSKASGTGYVIMPMGGASPGEEGMALYDAHHDSAVALLLEACRLLKIDPVNWPKAAERFAREAVLHVQERELA